jgi:pyruvate formate lyase activating enzyme
MTASIFNIQRFSIHDGPGIRTTVFMKGCPLRCHWCSNPESQEIAPQLMTRDVKCVGCGACVQRCPHDAMRLNPQGGREIDWDACRQCLLCVDACRYHALDCSGEEMEIETVVEEILSDRLFYKNSGGGVTVSGGEPLLQSEFVLRLVERCRQKGLHIAIDTTGCVAWQKIEAAAAAADLMLWDIKHMDPQIHEQATGVSNRLILENLMRASKLVRIWLRIPLIAEFNDSREHVDRIIALARKIKAEKISLLPYHEGGRAKSQQIGKSYLCPDARAPAEEKIEALRKRIFDAGLPVNIGK